MYQANDKIEFIEIANDIAQWSELLFGYFVKSNKSDQEKAQQVSAFADELSVLPSDCMNHIQKAKARWVEEAHTRPPSIPQFLQMLREFRNIELNNSARLIEHDKSSVYSETAKAWDGAIGDEGKCKFLKTFARQKTAPATKWVMREWMRENGFTENKITHILGYGW